MTDKTMTADAFAATLLLYATPAEMQRARKEMDIAAGELCPECGSSDTESNGATRHSDLSFRCVDHDHRWDAADCTLTLPARAPRR